MNLKTKKLSDNLVLIVDDSASNLDMLLDAFGGICSVTAAKDGETALKLISNTTPDIILLDIEMPGIDGYEVCRILKADEKYCKIPIIFITAYSGIEYEAKGLTLGAADFIIKPFNIELVKARVKNHLMTKMLMDDKEFLIKELTESLANIKTLKALLPICSHCKKIRDDEGYWNQVDTYIAKNTETQFSHGICPDCLIKYYPDIANDVIKEMNKHNQV